MRGILLIMTPSFPTRPKFYGVGPKSAPTCKIRGTTRLLALVCANPGA